MCLVCAQLAKLVYQRGELGALRASLGDRLRVNLRELRLQLLASAGDTLPTATIGAPELRVR